MRLKNILGDDLYYNEYKMKALRKEYVLGLVFFLFFVGCREKNGNEFLSGIKNIKGSLMDVDCLIGRPGGLILYDSLLFVYDPYEGNVLTVLDTRNSQCKNRLLSIGQGPGEVDGPVKLSVTPKQKKMNAFQMQSGIFSMYDINGIELVYQESVHFPVHFSDRPVNVVAIQDAFIGIGLFEKGRYHVYDKQGNQIHEVGLYPFDGEKMNPQARFFLYQGHLCSQPDGTHFAMGSSYSDNIEFYEIRENQVELLEKYGSREVKAKFNQVLELDDDCLLGYSGSYGTERYCYMLYSGKTYSENKHRRIGATHIFVFEWDGNFVKSYRLGNETLAFCVDEDNNIFYGIVLHRDEFVIMKFEMG